MSKMKNCNHPCVLLVAFHSYAGMGPYVISIVNSFKADDNVRFFLSEREDCYYSRNIKEELKHLVTIVTTRTPNKIETLYSVITGFRCKYRKQIREMCETWNISIVHDLTGTTDGGLVKAISKSRTWLYTVHDLYPHEAKKSFFKMWRQKRIYNKTFRAIEQSDSLITNSKSQFCELTKRYPNKHNFNHPFPSLINETIRLGNVLTPEIDGLKDYILFFGRIEEYKGLSLLLDAFKNVANGNIKLVIAGKGELPYYINDKGIIFINRYLDDREIANLYLNSFCVVYPYLSATQSGVLAVASFFGTPIIASDVPFFKEVLGEKYIGLFKAGNINDLTSKLKYYMDLSNEAYIGIKDQMKRLYEINYNDYKQRKLLLSIYATIYDNRKA